MTTSPPSSAPVTEGKKGDLWDQIGFHRPLGGFMYNYVLGFVGIIFGVVVGGLLISLLYPYPESKGYRDLAGMVFVWAMPLIDFGVAYGIERFIGEWRVKDQAKMVEFIRFFAWYGLFSSLFKTTVFSIVTFTFIREGNLAYLSWNLLFLAIQQYPGIQNLFRSCLTGLQQYHKANLLNLVGSEIFDKVFLLIFIFMWRNIGNQNPALGELMTMAFGTTFAYYMRDFFMFGVQVAVIRPILKGMNISMKELLIPKFSRETIKVALRSGLQVSVVNIIAQANAYLITMVYVGNVVNYTTFSVLSSTALSFINFIDYFGKIDMTAPFSEAYQNGKKKLSAFYMAQIWKYWGYVNGSMMLVFAAFLQVLSTTILAVPGLENYALIGTFLIPAWFYKFFLPLAEQGDTILVSSMRLKVFQILRILEEGSKILWILVIIFILRWQGGGPLGIAFLLIFSTAVPQWIKITIEWIYLRKKLLPYQIPAWQAFGAPMLSGLLNYLFVTLYLSYIHPLYLTILGPLLAGVITIVIVLLILPTLSFSFFYGFLGGWDEFGLETYAKASTIAGPSKIFYRAAAKLTRWAAKHSPLTNRFPIPNAEAIEEIRALTEMKKAAQAKQNV